MTLRHATDTKPTTARASPGRPRNFDREEILDRALLLFWKNGFAQTTTRALEIHLGLNQSSLYNSFGSKANFFDHVLERYERKASGHLFGPLQHEQAGIDTLKEYFAGLARWMNQDGCRGCLLINAIVEDGGSSPGFARRADRFRSVLTQIFTELLERTDARGETAAGDCDARARILLTLTFGMNASARGGASERQLAELAEAINQQIDSWRAQA